MRKIYLLIIFLSITTSYAQLSIVKDVAATSLAPQDSDNLFWQNNKWNGKHYYPVTAYPSVNLAETDGTVEGTKITKTFGFTGVQSSTIKKIIPVRDFFYIHVNIFVSYSPWTYRDELWKSDGTAAGTVLVKRFDDRGMLTNPLELAIDQYDYENKTINGNEMYFLGYDAVHGSEMWKTDGTTAGTVMVKDMYTGTSANVIGSRAYTRLGSDIFFYSNYKLWKTDGTDAGTVMLDVPGLTVVDTYRMTAFKGKLYFMGYDATNGVELWTSDGTVGGTHIFTNTSPKTDNLYSLTSFNLKSNSNYLLFSTLQSASSTAHTLYITDGTVAGTKQISDPNAIDAGSNSGSTLYHYNNEVFYCYNNTQKTFFKYDFNSGISKVLSHPNIATNPFSYQNTAWYSSGTSNVTGNNDFNELYKTDGIQGFKAFDINPNVLGTSNSGSYPFGFFELNNYLYFFANPGAGMKLYKFYGDYTFNNSVNGNWSNGTNWNAKVIPLSTDNASIPTGFNVTVDAYAYAKNLSVMSPVNLATGSLNISGELAVDAKITLNNNNLNLLGTASRAEGNSTNYIVTNGAGTVNLENLNSARGTVNLPIGTSTNYNPISISNSGTSDTFSARVSDTSEFTSGGINATWEISEATSGGSNVNLSLAWNSTQQQSDFSPTTAKIVHKLSGVWNEENSGAVSGTNPYSITATGISSFSPFSVAVPSVVLGTSNLSKSKVSVYPNPFSENLNISTQENATIYFYDLSGKLIFTEFLMKGNNLLNKSSLQKGIYLYQIKGKDGSVVSSGKVIKK